MNLSSVLKRGVLLWGKMRNGPPVKRCPSFFHVFLNSDRTKSFYIYIYIYIYWICSGSLVGITMNQSYAILLFTKKKVAPTDPYRHGKMASTRETHCNFRNPKIARMPFKGSWCGCHLTVKLYIYIYIYANYIHVYLCVYMRLLSLAENLFCNIEFVYRLFCRVR